MLAVVVACRLELAERIVRLVCSVLAVVSELAMRTQPTALSASRNDGRSSSVTARSNTRKSASVSFTLLLVSPLISNRRRPRASPPGQPNHAVTLSMKTRTYCSAGHRKIENARFSETVKLTTIGFRKSPVFAEKR